MTALVWFRKDLRLHDNPAWNAAGHEHGRAQALYVMEDALWASAGAHRARQLAANLRALDARLKERGGALLVVSGPATVAVPQLARDYDAVYWNADYSPFAVRRDREVEANSPAPTSVHHGTVIHRPGAVLNRDGQQYRVFTPFYRTWRATPWDPWPIEADTEPDGRRSEELQDAAGPPLYEPGERAAQRRLEHFVERVDRYHEHRGLLGRDNTSQLSTDLKFGTISPRDVVAQTGDHTDGRYSFTRQLAWRDFHIHALAAFPHGYAGALQTRYAAVAWREDPEGFEAWRRGRTGYPIVDAAMRQLDEEGRIHNRARMIAASFLVKDLLIDWRLGERHFRRLLVDADPAQNIGNWQWVAGTGFDAAPYFRVINPVTQSRRYDPDGDYIRRWVPELSELQGPAVHAPWLHDDDVTKAGLSLGDDYPWPLVDHGAARRRALAAYRAARDAVGLAPT